MRVYERHSSKFYAAMWIKLRIGGGNDSHRKCYSRHPWPALLSCSNWTRLSRQSDLGYNSYDCCGQHEDTFYFFGSGVIYSNVIHDAAPLGAANLYIETCSGNPCTTGNTTYLFNNVVWNIGRSTPPIGFSSEFWGSSDVSPHPSLYAYNNTLYALSGTADCINAGQWLGNSSAYTVNFSLHSNHCISSRISITLV